MDHDPLCSFETYHTTDVCECSLIEKVRADERSRPFSRVVVGAHDVSHQSPDE